MSDVVGNSLPPNTGHKYKNGHPKYGGRQRGTTNREVEMRRERLAEAERVANVAIGDFNSDDMHEFLLTVARNGNVPLASRIECAKIVYGTQRAKLAAIAVIDPSSVPTINIRDIRTELQLIEHKPGVVLDAVLVETETLND